MLNALYGEIFLTNIIIFILARFRPNLLVAKPFTHTHDRTNFNTVHVSSHFLLLIMTLVSSANIMGSDSELILTRRYLMYIINSKGLGIDLSGMPCFNA